MYVVPDAFPSNRVLAQMRGSPRAALAARLDPVRLTVREVIYELDEPIRYVYFPLRGVVSVVVKSEPLGVVEVATIGNEGMVGIPILLGTDRAPMRSFVQIPGDALRMRAEALHEAVKDPDFNRILHRYVQCFITQIAQSSACNRAHSLDERCARWLLMTHDRVKGDEFPLTQEFLGAMLGVRRAGVSVAAATMQRAGLIEYKRGVIRVLNRAGLEAASCECYGIVEAEYDRLLGTDLLGHH